jgi:hypothetical protein
MKLSPASLGKPPAQSGRRNPDALPGQIKRAVNDRLAP